jgi:transposase-like protein
MVQRGSPSKRTVWRNRLKRYGASGLAVAEFCGQEGISTASFYAWRKRLRGTKTTGKEGRVFEPVRLRPAGRPMSVHLPGGVRVEVPTENLDAVRAVVGEVLARAGGAEGADEPC